MTTDERLTIAINVAELDGDELTTELRRHLGPAAAAVEFFKQPRASEFRSAVDSSLLLAAVGAAGTALGALITGLLAIGKERKSKRLVLKTNGITMDIPVDAPSRTVEKLTQLMREHKINTLILLNAPRARVADHYVAVCDVLGFKRIVESTSLDAVVGRYRQLLENVDSVRREVGHCRVPNCPLIHNPINYAVFSDTLLLWTPELDGESDASQLGAAHDFFDFCTGLLCLGMRVDLPLRLGVAMGKAFFDPEHSLYVGQAIIDAYLTEQDQNWVGGACHSSCDNAPGFDKVCEWQWVWRYPVPRKRTADSNELWALDWTVWTGGWRWQQADVIHWIRNKESSACNSAKAKYASTENFFFYCDRQRQGLS